MQQAITPPDKYSLSDMRTYFAHNLADEALYTIMKITYIIAKGF